jgi:tetratricopeptide (TPR) repeat protein
MDPDEALDFLTKLAGPERVDAEPEAADQIVALCGYLPLALRIAGSRLGARPAWSLTWLARRLAHEQARLQELKVEDLEVRASFAFSYRDLGPSAARMFRRLGLVAGPDFAAGGAAVLCETSPEEAEALLEELADAHLLEAAPTPGRYRFHDLLRLYARERLQAEEPDHEQASARCRMLNWYLDTAECADRLLAPNRHRLQRGDMGKQSEQIFSARSQALDWLDTERASLVAAIHQAADRGLYPIAWRLADALFSFFNFRKHWADWQDTHEVGLSAAQHGHDLQAEAWILGSLAGVHHDLRQADEAISCSERSLAIAREILDRQSEARTLGNLGIIYLELGRFEEAIDYLQQALAICREIRDHHREGINLTALAEVHTRLGRFEEAINHCQRALAMHQEAGDRYREAEALDYLGDAYRGLSQLDEALKHYYQALAIKRDIGDRYGEGHTLNNLGLALQRTHDIDGARASWHNALAIFTELKTPKADETRVQLAGLEIACEGVPQMGIKAPRMVEGVCSSVETQVDSGGRPA